MLLPDIEHLIESGGVEFQQRCSFCNGLEEAEGSLGVEMEPGQFMELPIGPMCLEAAQNSSAEWVDNPGPGVVE